MSQFVETLVQGPSMSISETTATMTNTSTKVISSHIWNLSLPLFHLPVITQVLYHPRHLQPVRRQSIQLGGSSPRHHHSQTLQSQRRSPGLIPKYSTQREAAKKKHLKKEEREELRIKPCANGNIDPGHYYLATPVQSAILQNR